MKNVKQEPILNEHNKQEYPPMHTDEIDTPLKKPSVLKKTIDWLVKYWWRIHCFLVLQTFIIVFAMFVSPGGWFEGVTFILFDVLILLEIVLLVMLLVRKRWLHFFISLILMIGFVVVVIPILSFLPMSAPDGFAKRHPIPDGLKYEKPLGYICTEDGSVENWEASWNTPVEPTIDSTDNYSYLQIWCGFQGGIYKYDFYYPSLPAGTIFLRCFEAGKNEPLSVDRIKESSSVNIPAINSFSKIVDKREFTIYEGDWEEYYAVRVEVWHRDRATHNEQKLIEKNYLMDGWMR